MIHPHPCDPVAVCYKITVPVADDRCICPVDPHSTKVFLDHQSYSAGVHEKE